MKRLTGLSADNGWVDIISTHSLMKRLTDTAVFDSLYPIISTHSLMKRLTRSRSLSFFFSNYFNSQPHEEADLSAFLQF